VRWMDRWAAYEQRKSDQRQARWQERQLQHARPGQTTWMDRWAAYEQRKSDRQLAVDKERYRLRRQVPRDPVQGPGGSVIVISVRQTGTTSWGQHGSLVGLMIWSLVFHHGYTVRVRTKGYPPVNMSVRLPSEAAAYRAAARLVSEFQAEGPAALQGHWAEAGSTT
jgi:hypothetical protein